MAARWIFVVVIFPLAALAAEIESPQSEQKADGVTRGGGRVIEYSEQGDQQPKTADKVKQQKKKPTNRGKSVELISGGNSSDGKPTVSQLPVLD